ncbi:hypothetical protein [Sporosarcina sp. OR05]|uniref:hypothetical protein n=1 Tax=Sporosarcina sp. OR05 TaxID=2969819 RepID=UPI00352A197C
MTKRQVKLPPMKWHVTVDVKRKAGIVLVGTVTILLLVYLLSQILSYPIGKLLFFSVICITGYALHKWASSYSNKKLPFEKLLKIELPEKIIRLRTWGFELVFALLLLSIGADPIKDLMDMKIPVYRINMLFLELAILFIVLSVLPMFIYLFIEKWKRPQTEGSPANKP